jgi:hypothetical protein
MMNMTEMLVQDHQRELLDAADRLRRQRALRGEGGPLHRVRARLHRGGSR